MYSIRFKLPAITLLFVFAFMTAITVYWARAHVSEMRTSFDAMMRQTATFLAPPLANAVWNFEVGQAEKALLGLEVNDSYLFSIVRSDGDIFVQDRADLDDRADGWDPLDIGDGAGTLADGEMQVELVDSDDDRIALIHVPLTTSDGRDVGTATFGFTTEAIDRSIDTLWRRACWIGLISAVLISLALYAFARSITVPLHNVAAAVAKVSRGDLDFENTDRDRRDEIGLIARAIDDFREKTRQLRHVERAREQERGRAEREREAMLAELSTSVGDVLSRAAVGDFSTRVGAEFDDDALEHLAGDLNKVLDIMETGLDEIRDAMSRLAEGDLDRPMQTDFPGTFGRVAHSVNSTMQKLGKIISEIDRSSRQVSDSARGAMRRAEAASHRSREQAAEVEKTSSSIEEVSSLVTRSAEALRGMAKEADTALAKATDSERIILAGASTIQNLETHSRQIFDVIRVIEDIASRTHLISLNASVEAAQAGSEGRGFAVVADEIRSLAEESKLEAARVSSILADSSEQTETGVRHMKSAEDLVRENMRGLRALTSVVKDVSRDVGSQAAQLNSAASSLQSFDESTRQNASAAQAAQQTARRLNQTARSLVSTLAVFGKTVEGEHVATARTAGAEHQEPPNAA